MESGRYVCYASNKVTDCSAVGTNLIKTGDNLLKDSNLSPFEEHYLCSTAIIENKVNKYSMMNF